MFNMKKQLKWAKLKVGVVITLAILLVLFTVFFAGDIEDLFVPKVEIKTQIKDVRGLRKGAPVWLSGIEVGFVEDMELHPEYGTLVTLSIKESALPFVAKDTTATVLTQGLLGDKYIELSNGTAGKGRLRPGDIIKGKTQLEIKDLVDASSESLVKVTEFVDRIGLFLERFEKSEGTFAQLLTDPSLYNNLKQTTANLSTLVKDLHESEGSLKRFMKDPTLYNKMLAATSSVEEFSNKMNNSQGTLQKLAEDPALYENLNKASHQLSALLAEIDSGKGTAGALVKDKQLAAELRETIGGLKETIGELKELTKDVKANPKKYFKFSLF